MPNRILRDYTDSAKFDRITADAERLFVRLVMKADDYGRFYADPRLVKAGVFPLEDQIRLNDLTRWLDELSHRQLILRYEVQGRSLLAIIKFGQRMRNTRSKFPPPEGKAADWLPDDGSLPQLAADCGGTRPETETETETEACTKSHTPRAGAGACEGPPGVSAEIPGWSDVQAHCATIGLPEWRARMWFDEMEAAGWRVKGQEVRKWRPLLNTVRTWWEADGKPMTPTGRNGKPARKPESNLMQENLIPREL